MGFIAAIDVSRSTAPIPPSTTNPTTHTPLFNTFTLIPETINKNSNYMPRADVPATDAKGRHLSFAGANIGGHEKRRRIEDGDNMKQQPIEEDPVVKYSKPVSEKGLSKRLRASGKERMEKFARNASMMDAASGERRRKREGSDSRHQKRGRVSFDGNLTNSYHSEDHPGDVRGRVYSTGGVLDEGVSYIKTSDHVGRFIESEVFVPSEKEMIGFASMRNYTKTKSLTAQFLSNTQEETPESPHITVTHNFTQSISRSTSIVLSREESFKKGFLMCSQEEISTKYKTEANSLKNHAETTALENRNKGINEKSYATSAKDILNTFSNIDSEKLDLKAENFTGHSFINELPNSNATSNLTHSVTVSLSHNNVPLMNEMLFCKSDEDRKENLTETHKRIEDDTKIVLNNLAKNNTLQIANDTVNEKASEQVEIAKTNFDPLNYNEEFSIFEKRNNQAKNKIILNEIQNELTSSRNKFAFVKVFVKINEIGFTAVVFPPQVSAADSINENDASNIESKQSKLQRAEAWYSKLCKMEEFIKAFGHSFVHLSENADHELKQWVQEQKKHLQVKIQGGRSPMTDVRLSACQKIGFFLEKLDHEKEWESNFKTLLAFREYYGHCLVPCRFRGNTGISTWVKMQRKLYVSKKQLSLLTHIKMNKIRTHKNGSSTPMMTDDDQAALESIGFKWTATETEELDAMWFSHLNELKEYRRVRGSFAINQHKPETAFLAAWMNSQRRHHRLKLRNEPNVLTDVREKALEGIDFNWERVNTWEMQFQKLLNFHKKHGHCSISKSYEDENFQNWIARQRQNYYDKVAGKQSGLSDSKQKKLEELGFVFQPLKHIWDNKLNDLQEFKRSNGHIKVPHLLNGTKKTHPLASWIYQNRSQMRVFANGEDSTLSKERFDKLIDIGLTTECPKESSWENMYKQLIAYKEVFGHTKVKYKDDKALGSWVNIQRLKYRQLKAGMPSSMPQERVDLLQKIGFWWGCARNKK